MKVNRVKLLAKVENLVCRILRVLSTENLIGLTSTKNEGSGWCGRNFFQTTMITTSRNISRFDCVVYICI